MKRYVLLLLTLTLTTLGAGAQGVKPLPSLHTEGRWLVDKHGNQVVLHGVMDTPNMYFNGWRWGSPWDSGNRSNYDDNGATKCLAYFEKLFTGMEQAKCDVFRLHLDPAWTNDPNDNYVYAGSKGQASDASGEADIKKFNPDRLTKFLPSLYLKLAEKAMKHGMYVVVRPPGVCPGNLKVGDYYQAYLMTVWDIFSQQDFVKEHAGQISIELANEPVALRNANNQDDSKALHDYFQPIVDKIRSNGFTGIIWAPGTTWQQNYRGYADYPIEGENIGYAVHDYCGWYGCSDDHPDPQNKINQFHQSVPVIDFAPVIITEVDWSPVNPSAEGHYNESGAWVQPNYGTWATGSTSKWGKAYKTMLDYFGNISMTLSGTSCLIDVDQLLKDGSVVPAFGGLEEACGKACMDWYADYYQVNWPHADDEAETGDAYAVESLVAEKEDFKLMIGDKIFLSLKAYYRDGHTKDVTDIASYSISNPSVASVKNGYLCALANGEAEVTASYTDSEGSVFQKVFSVQVSGLGLSDFTALGSLSDISGKSFVILNKESQKAFYGSDNQNLGFDDPNQVFNSKSINGYMFKAESVSGRSGCYLLRLMTLSGGEYSLWGNPGYLNSQPVDGWCSFILGLNNQNGQDIKDGAVWEIQYVADKGFTLKNMGTGLYLKDNGPAKYDSPAYMDFLVAGGTTGVNTIQRECDNNAVYTLQGLKVATRLQWESLPHGIYIVGGKKMVK
jgi:hypothetical protein